MDPQPQKQVPYEVVMEGFHNHEMYPDDDKPHPEWWELPPAE